MFDGAVRNLQSSISLLQLYILNRQKSGFKDMERMLEVLCAQLFKAVEVGDFINMNQIKVNFPAIDLADDAKSIAIQVTSNATPAKIKKTIAAFEKKNEDGISLKDKYAKLYIWGFCKASTIETPLPAYCEVVGCEFVVDKLVDLGDAEKVVAVLNAVIKHETAPMLHPWQDVDCLKVMLLRINRDAIKHQMICEGSVEKMIGGLQEITQIITTGKLNGRQESKPYSEFNDHNIQDFLTDTLQKISRIKAIVNAKKDPEGNFVCLNFQDRENIDKIKASIADEATKIAKQYKIKLRIEMTCV
ncbi:SMEK domain-containing protein [Pseudomonas sp. PSE1(2024)]|uniref:SMEK domain-containing protein n=1 Tax=Pseudomonas sp. PSE1(2024) TaxID=3228746 RepID=UPI003D965875